MAAVTTRAKFRCSSEKTTKWGPNADRQRSYEFDALYDTSIPEDQRYAKATPTGRLTITVDNPAVTFEIGQSYYLDITKADA